jgi:flagellar protein FlbT
MAGLALKLAPKEQVMINGVLVENGPRRSQLLIKTENAKVLRMRDALYEDDLIGPASEAYYAAQRSVAGELSTEEAAKAIRATLPVLDKLDPESVAAVEKALESDNHYRAMRSLRSLVDDERARSVATG